MFSDAILLFFIQNEPATRILEFSVLHLAMSEIAVLGTRHQIVINEVGYSFHISRASRETTKCTWSTFFKGINF